MGEEGERENGLRALRATRPHTVGYIGGGDQEQGAAAQAGAARPPDTLLLPRHTRLLPRYTLLFPRHTLRPGQRDPVSVFFLVAWAAGLSPST